MLLNHVAVNGSHLLHIQFARQDNHVGKLRVEPERLGVGDIQLRGQMHLHAHLIGILHDTDVGGDDSGQAGLFGVVHNLAHEGQILGIHHRVEGKIGLNPRSLTTLDDGVQVGCSEVGRRAGTHIQVFYAKIDTIRTGLNCCTEALPTPYRSHYFVTLQQKMLIVNY